MKHKNLTVLITGAMLLSLAAPVYAEETVSGEGETEALTETQTEEPNAVLSVELGDYSQFTYTYTINEVTDEAVEEQIQSVLESTTPEIQYEETGTVADGDAIRLTTYGTIDGEEDDSLTIDEAETVVGSGELLEQFESQLVGLEAGKETEITFTFPEDYWGEDVAGKTAVMYVTINGIGQPQSTPELDDVWVAEHTEFSTVQEYRASVKETQEDMARSDADFDAYSQLTTQLVENAAVTYDEDTITQLKDQRIQEMKDAAEAEEVSYEEYLATYYGVDEDSYNDQAEDEVKEAQKRRAVIQAFAEAENVDLSEQAYLSYVEKTAALYGYDSGDAYLEELSIWGFESYVRESFEDEAVGAKLKEMAKEIPAEQMSEAEWDMEDWEFDTEVFGDFEWESEDFEFETDFEEE